MCVFFCRPSWNHDQLTGQPNLSQWFTGYVGVECTPAPLFNPRHFFSCFSEFSYLLVSVFSLIKRRGRGITAPALHPHIKCHCPCKMMSQHQPKLFIQQHQRHPFLALCPARICGKSGGWLWMKISRADVGVSQTLAAVGPNPCVFDFADLVSYFSLTVLPFSPPSTDPHGPKMPGGFLFPLEILAVR